MTLVWKREKRGSPQTHAFIIGVGAYRHPPGGKSSKRTTPGYGLKQLTSPPLSARAFADWLLSEYHHPEAPLGSVELLLSEQVSTPYQLPDGRDVSVQPATIAAIHGAFQKWFDRCQQYSDNIAIFYFCGHGVMIQGDHILLAEDFGTSPFQPFANAINFDSFRRGMAQCQIRAQYFFVDACSDVLLPGLNIERACANSLIQPRWTDPDALALVLKASPYGQSAYGQPGQVGLFTQALLCCLQGLACVYETGEWVVTTDSLGSVVPRVMNRLYSLQGVPHQNPSCSNSLGHQRVHVRQTPPLIPLTIRFDPQHAMADAQLTLTSWSNQTWQASREPFPNDWVFDNIEPGHYDLRATFQAGGYLPIWEKLWVMPPGPEPWPDPIRCRTSNP